MRRILSGTKSGKPKQGRIRKPRPGAPKMAAGNAVPRQTSSMPASEHSRRIDSGQILL